MTENSKKPEETPAEWYRFAGESRQAAERELTHEEPAAHTVCFLCQSAAEKYLSSGIL